MNKPAQPHVSVVNDDRTQLLIWTELLKKDGLDACSYPSAEAALQAMQAGSRPDLVVTDLHMSGIDGWRFCRLLRSPEYPAFNRTPILVMSATFSGEDAQQITAALGANAFLPTPIEPHEFLEHVHKLLKGDTPPLTNRILIVEDDTHLVAVLQKGFARHGYLTEGAYTAAEALRLCRAQQPEIVVVDFHLPDIEGDVLLDEICRISPQSTVVMITGDSRPELALDWMKRGARAYVQKPFDIEYLITLCEKARREVALLRIEDRLEERTHELRESEKRWRELLEGLTDALFVSELTADGLPGRFVEVNNAACLRLGYTRTELLQLSPADINGAHNKLNLRSIAARCEAGENVVFETVHVAKDGHRIPVEINVRQLSYRDHPALVGVARDITERKRAEENRLVLEAQIRQMQKLESLGIVAGGIAHDFNNLLMIILGNIEITLDNLPPQAPQREQLGEANQAVQQAAKLCRQMLAYSGRGKFVTATLNLNAMISDMDHILEPFISPKIALRQNLAANLPPIAVDAAQIRQVITNLVVNAAEAIGERDGGITLATNAQYCDHAMLAATWLREDLPAGLYVCIEVADTGCGMTAETLPRIFDPFFTTKFTGRGLGLAAVLGIIRGHKGALTVESAPERGTTFRIFFPVSSPAA